MRRHLPWLLLLVAAAALVWCIVVVVTGGFVVRTTWLRFSSRDAFRPLALFLVALLWYVAQFRHEWKSHAEALGKLPLPEIVAGVAAVSAVAIGIGLGTFVAGGSDASGYVSQAAMWTRGELTKPAAAWSDNASWNGAAGASAPLGYRLKANSQRLSPTYPPGLPLLMAAFQRLAGDHAVYYVVPLLGGLAVWLTYVLGSTLWTAWAGAIASVWLVTSPAFLWMLVQPMSDVPATAFWTLALVAACQKTPRPFLASAGAGAAVLIRPNLAPLSIVVALLLIAKAGNRAGRIKRVGWFGVALIPLILGVGILNWYLHGSPLRFGYGPTEDFFSTRNILPNLQYLRWMAESQTPLVFAGVLAPFLAPARGDGFERTLRHVVIIGFPLAVFALYLPYTVFKDWWYIRFLLPAYPLLLGSLAAVLVALASRVRPRAIGATLVAVGVVALTWRGAEAARQYGAFDLDQVDARYTETADYVNRLPANSVVVSLNHSGSINHYTGRDVLRWDLLDSQRLDDAVAELRQRGHPVYLVTDGPEIAEFHRWFAGARTLDGLAPVTTFSEHVVLFALGGTPQPAPAESSPRQVTH